MEMEKCKRGYTGFTLAEVLITLGIIGIVASITIPILISNVQATQYKTAYKKSFSDLSNALNTARLNDEFVSIDGNPTNVRTNWDALKSHFNISKSCENSITDGCWIDTCNATIKDCSPSAVPGEGEGNSWGFIDASGRFWNHYKSSHQDYFQLIVDTNGAQGPNRYGRDKWFFFIYDLSGLPNAGVPYKVGLRSNMLPQTTTGCSLGNCYYKSYILDN